jgi:NADH:ubiquinone oxidoreductase subunit K
MAGIFDSIPIITVVLFAIGVVGIMVYERAKSRKDAQQTT